MPTRYPRGAQEFDDAAGHVEWNQSFASDRLMLDQRAVLGSINWMECDDPESANLPAPQRRLSFEKKAVACPSSASIWLPIVVLNARDRTNLSSHVARGTNLLFGKPSRDIGCRRSLIAGNARKKAASSRRRTLLMSRLPEISGRNSWIMRTRKACAPGTTTPRDDLDDEFYCAASDAVCIAQR